MILGKGLVGRPEWHHYYYYIIIIIILTLIACLQMPGIVCTVLFIPHNSTVIPIQ